MRYEVHYLVGGEEHTEYVDAADAAEAASNAQTLHGTLAEPFELLSVNLIDDLAGPPVDDPGIDAASVE